MKSDKKIKDILDDLYKIDPEFKKHEKKIAKIIKELLLLQPEIKPDSRFIEDLRNMLKMEEKNVVRSKKDVKKGIEEKKNKDYFFSFNFLFDLSRSFVIVSVLLLLVVSFSFVELQKQSPDISKNDFQNKYLDILSETKIVKKDKNSFGSLYSQSTSLSTSFQESSSAISSRPLGASSEAIKMMSSDTSGFGAGGSFASAPQTEDILNFENGVSGDEMSVMRMPVRYNYIYTGGDFDMFKSEEDVFKKTVPNLSKELANDFIGKSFSLVDFSKFTDVGISNFNLLEDRDFGYSVYFGLEDGSFSLYKNWKRWPRAETLCGGWENYQCFEDYQLSFNEVLSNQEILQISDDFLKNYKIDISNYGPGEVQNEWMRDYYLSSDKASYYIPESISVIYPLTIEGRTVYEEYGQKTGLSVDVDIREKKVAGLYGLFYQQYESSSYETETNKDKIMELVYRGGEYPYYDYFEDDFNYEVIDIELGAPRLDLVKIWNYDNYSMISQELYVPAYVFPVISQSKDSYFYKKNVVIPAVKEFFDRYNNFDGPNVLPVLMGDGNISVSNEIGFDDLLETERK
ncbi:hypothetical protein CVU82_03835 [Candidatus Falkowbacteria bacterium HGW-Falkowbacteria-1]|uniref:Uncharacterized protein n=1 Tax=Candidatus Falkowbacteria bacterium HGW-Falkowbacteria-1 TaxID=2013768 RepID=A0A2N2E8T3_9BACT|nr:MAG: hypothetical protein CVU82_03835 [Candidatus Falkowbacteria bacterium HGW-Falkowbacteria-1]